MPAHAIDSKKYIASVLVMRRDGKKMTDDLAVAAEAFPPTDTTELKSHPDDDAILEAGRALGTKSGSAKKRERS